MWGDPDPVDFGGVPIPSYRHCNDLGVPTPNFQHWRDLGFQALEASSLITDTGMLWGPASISHTSRTWGPSRLEDPHPQFPSPTSCGSPSSQHWQDLGSSSPISSLNWPWGLSQISSPIRF